jgi:hypothetical protein
MSREFNSLHIANIANAVGVCNSGAKAWGGDDGSAGAAGGGDTRGVQGAGNSSHASDFHLVQHDELQMHAGLSETVSVQT